jgi:hypothetical protein
MIFAGTMMVLAGLFQIFLGIAALAHDKIFVLVRTYAFKFDATAWGWIHLILGIAVAVIGFYVFTAAQWSRYVAIGLVALQGLSSFLFLPYYPFWTLVIIALDIFIIWSLAAAPGHRTVYHREFQATSTDAD